MVRRIAKQASPVKKREKPTVVYQGKERGEAGTIGSIFDYYQKQERKTMPANAMVNAGRWRGNEPVKAESE